MSFVKPMRFHAGAAVIIAILLPLAVGCSQEEAKGTVKGKVEYKGKPYTAAAVCFLDLQSGMAASANIEEDGTFQLEPLPLGNYKVYLAPKIGDPLAEAKPVQIDNSVPGKYWSETTTDISHEVTAGINEMTMTLEK